MLCISLNLSSKAGAVVSSEGIAEDLGNIYEDHKQSHMTKLSQAR